MLGLPILLGLLGRACPASAQAAPPAPVPVVLDARTAAELAQAQQLLLGGKASEAEALLRPLIARAPGQGEAWALLGMLLHAQKRELESAEAFGRAATLLPPSPTLFNNAGVARFEAQGLELAQALFEKTLALAPQDSRAHMYLGRIALQRGDVERAEREFAASIAGPQTDPLAFYHRGVFLLQERRLEEAAVCLQRAVELTPALAGAHLSLGLALQRLGRTDEAQKELQRFRELTEIQTSEQRLRVRLSAALQVAQRDLEAGNYEAALASLNKAAQDAPEQPLVYDLLALAYQRAGRAPESQAAARQAQAIRERAARPPR